MVQSLYRQPSAPHAAAAIAADLAIAAATATAQQQQQQQGLSCVLAFQLLCSTLILPDIAGNARMQRHLHLLLFMLTI
jgi:hypothetical protein